MTGLALTTGFETPQALQEFNAAGRRSEYRRRKFGHCRRGLSNSYFRRLNLRATMVRSKDDLVEFERRMGLSVRYGPDFMDWVRDESAREGTPLKQ
jgi:hypothetical protein